MTPRPTRMGGVTIFGLTFIEWRSDEGNMPPEASELLRVVG